MYPRRLLPFQRRDLSSFQCKDTFYCKAGTSARPFLEGTISGLNKKKGEMVAFKLT